jgi:hypothetical protein
MDIEAFEELHDVRLIRKSDSWLMRLIGFFSADFMDFYTTYRLPLQARVTICYPDTLEEPSEEVLDHELVHALDFERWWGPWFMALVIFPPGRWYVERWAYLQDIQRGRYTAQSAAEMLWEGYRIKTWGWPSPRKMHQWFTERL